MTTLNRASLPEKLTINSKEYIRHEKATQLPIEQQAAELESNGYLVAIVNVLSSNLKGVTNWHGRLYGPTQWIFIHKK